jgi:uncharacterized membrane protein
VATLSAWKFDDAEGAGRAEELLITLQKQQLIYLHDAATVAWETGRTKPTTRQAIGTGRLGALTGSFWGMLFGFIFFAPLLGAAIGAALGAVGGALVDVGIDDDFIEAVRLKVVPGTSALFVLTSDAIQDKVVEAFQSAGLHPEIISTNLSQDEESRLQMAFAEDS